MSKNPGRAAAEAAGFGRRSFLKVGGGLGLGIAAMPLLSACGDGGSDGGDGGDLVIAKVLPTTGDLVSTFAPLYIGADIARREINGSGGILGRKIVFKDFDDEASPAKEPLVARKLASENIQYVLGPTGSSQSLASLAVTTGLKMVSTAFANDGAVADAGKFPYHYHTIYNTLQQGQVAGEYLTKTRKITKVGIIAESTSFGETATDAAVEAMKKAGVSPTSVQKYPADAQDLRPYVERLKDSGAEAVIVWTVGLAPTAMVFNSMNDLDWFPLVAGHSTLFFGTLFDLVPARALENVYGTTYRTMSWSDDQDADQRHIDYAKAISAEKGAKGFEPSVAAGPFYDFLFLVKQAAESAGSLDSTKVKAELDKITDFDGMLGTMSFTADDHSGLGPEALTLASALSGQEKRAYGALRKRAPGIA